MTLPSSGAIAFSAIQTEFGGTNPISLSEYYAGGAFVPGGTSGTNGAVPSSGTIGVNRFYGTTAFVARGFMQGGIVSGSIFRIETVAIDTLGNFTTYGTVADHSQRCYAACANLTRIIWWQFDTAISYSSVASTGSLLAFGLKLFGDTEDDYNGSCCSSTRGIIFGGENFDDDQNDTMEYVTIATLGNTTMFGLMTEPGSSGGVYGSTTRGICLLGIGSLNFDKINYVTIATAGNGTTFGTMLTGKIYEAAASNSTRGISFGGQTTGTPTTSSMEYLTIATTGNGTSFGSMTGGTRVNCLACSSSTRAVLAFGSNNVGAYYTTAEYVTIATTGNTAAFGNTVGDNIVADVSRAATSNAHGGL